MKKGSKKRLKLLKGEVCMYFILLALVIALPVVNVFSKALLSESNIRTEKLKDKIEKQTASNDSLEMQVDELVSMENIQKIAELYGLSYISENIVNINLAN